MSNLFGTVNRVQPGELLCIQADGWEDSKVLGVFLVLREFSPADESQQYFAAAPVLETSALGRGGQLTRTLIEKGLLVQVRLSSVDLFLGRGPEDLSFDAPSETVVEEANLPAPISLNEAMARLPG